MKKNRVKNWVFPPGSSVKKHTRETAVDMRRRAAESAEHAEATGRHRTNQSARLAQTLLPAYHRRTALSTAPGSVCPRREEPVACHSPAYPKSSASFPTPLTPQIPDSHRFPSSPPPPWSRTSPTSHSSSSSSSLLPPLPQHPPRSSPSTRPPTRSPSSRPPPLPLPLPLPLPP